MEKQRKLRYLSGIFQTAMFFSASLFAFSFAYYEYMKKNSDVFKFLFPAGTFLLLMLNVILVIIVRRRLETHKNDNCAMFRSMAINPPATYSNDLNGIPEINVNPMVHLTPSARDFPMFPQDREYPIFAQGGSSLGYVNQSSSLGYVIDAVQPGTSSTALPRMKVQLRIRHPITKQSKSEKEFFEFINEWTLFIMWTSEDGFYWYRRKFVFQVPL